MPRSSTAARVNRRQRRRRDRGPGPDAPGPAAQRAGDEISTGLRILTARRADKSADRVRAINRLQAQLLEYFPALERAFDYSRSKGALLLLTKYRTPDGIRRTGQARIHAWLKKHGTRSSAQAAIDAAKSQHTTVPAQHHWKHQFIENWCFSSLTPSLSPSTAPQVPF